MDLPGPVTVLLDYRFGLFNQLLQFLGLGSAVGLLSQIENGLVNADLLLDIDPIEGIAMLVS